MFIKTCLLFYFLLCIIACNHSLLKKEHYTSGVIEFKGQLFDTSGNQFSRAGLTTIDKIWYMDSFIVEEVHYVKIVSDATSSTETNVLENYRFNDLRNRTIYEYKNFSDTAKLIRSYFFDDTIKIFGGWNFLQKRKLQYSKSENMTDTTIDRIRYQRVRLIHGTETDPYYMIGYFRCDRKTTLFIFDSLLNKQIGCPMVKLYNYSPFKRGIPSLSEINFLSDTLTIEESKVFDAWKKNADNSPVIK